MRRDPDVIRKLLLAVEAQSTPTGIADPESVQYMKWLQQAGYVEAQDVSTLSARAWRITGLTWKGAEVVDLIRDERRWAHIKKRVGSAPFELIEEVAMDFARREAQPPGTFTNLPIIEDKVPTMK